MPKFGAEAAVLALQMQDAARDREEVTRLRGILATIATALPQYDGKRMENYPAFVLRIKKTARDAFKASN